MIHIARDRAYPPSLQHYITCCGEIIERQWVVGKTGILSDDAKARIATCVHCLVQNGYTLHDAKAQVVENALRKDP